MKEMPALKMVNWHSGNSDSSMTDKLKDFFSPNNRIISRMFHCVFLFTLKRI